MLRKWGMLVVMLLLTPMLAFAQNTGKISGRVIDRDTGESIPGANVAVVGTTYGSITDVDGNYFILGVPVGTYDVRASFVGYTPESISGVQISSGYTRELNFSLSEGVELGEVVVEYERPLIQKDAVGAPKIVDAEQIVNLPVRGVQSVAAIQAGVVSQEGSSTLNIRGGRGSEVSYYIDGVKVVGTTALPQSAIQEQEMMIGSISARYGDAMSGVINITTKSGSPSFFGSVEGITSEALDSYGYNLLSATVGGPLGTEKVNFFLAGEFTDQLDSSPRAVGELHLPDDILNDLRAAPQAFQILDADGNTAYLPIPSTLDDGATLNVDNTGHILHDNNQLVFSDGTTIALPEGADFETLNLEPVFRGELLDPSQFVREDARYGNQFSRLSATGNITLSLFDQGRLRLGGRVITQESDGLAFLDVVYSPGLLSQNERTDYQLFGTWTQHLSGSTFYQLQVDYLNRFGESYDPRFGKNESDWFRYGNVDAEDGTCGESVFQALCGYKNSAVMVPVVVGTDTVMAPSFTNVYEDGRQPASQALANIINPVGGGFVGYSKNSFTQFRLTASATTQVGINQLEFGGEYETRTSRNWGINAAGLSRYVNDGDAEAVSADPNLDQAGYCGGGFANCYDQFISDSLLWPVLDAVAGGVGYSIDGREKTDTEDMAAFVTENRYKSLSDRTIAPSQPIYYGGYVQNKIEFRDIVLNLGLRVDVFDNNVRTLIDPLARLPIERAGLISDRPSNVGADYAVYYDGSSDNVVGYRDVDGNFFDTNGEQVQAAEILLNGTPHRLVDPATGSFQKVNEDMFTDYEPQVTAMPRIGVSFPVTDRALFFASYGIVSQRPSGRNYATMSSLTGTGGIDNNNLKPERTTKYELGFRQRLGERSALTISGFFHQIDNLIQLRSLPTAFPNEYSTYENVDFGTVKGMEFGFDMRRTNGFAGNVNYTLSFADGTGSGDRTTSTIVWIDETPPNFISPLDFDQRHKINVSLDYRIGSGEGPEVGGMHLLENFGLNVLFTAGSGFPYTAISDPYPVNASRAPFPTGGINSNRQPSSNRIDLKLDRRFQVGGRANVTAFLWIENLLNSDNVQSVWRATGLADSDGFLATPDGQAFLANNPPAMPALYDYRINQPGNYGIPRLTRLGLRLDF